VKEGDGNRRRIMSVFHSRSCGCLFHCLISVISPMYENFGHLAFWQLETEDAFDVFYSDAARA
jgi:hypothetical protein